MKKYILKYLTFIISIFFISNVYALNLPLSVVESTNSPASFNYFGDILTDNNNYKDFINFINSNINDLDVALNNLCNFTDFSEYDKQLYFLIPYGGNNYRFELIHLGGNSLYIDYNVSVNFNFKNIDIMESCNLTKNGLLVNSFGTDHNVNLSTYSGSDMYNNISFTSMVNRLLFSSGNIEVVGVGTGVQVSLISLPDNKVIYYHDNHEGFWSRLWNDIKEAFSSNIITPNDKNYEYLSRGLTYFEQRKWTKIDSNTSKNYAVDLTRIIKVSGLNSLPTGYESITFNLTKPVLLTRKNLSNACFNDKGYFYVKGNKNDKFNVNAWLWNNENDSIDTSLSESFIKNFTITRSGVFDLFTYGVVDSANEEFVKRYNMYFTSDNEFSYLTLGYNTECFDVWNLTDSEDFIITNPFTGNQYTFTRQDRLNKLEVQTSINQDKYDKAEADRIAQSGSELNFLSFIDNIKNGLISFVSSISVIGTLATSFFSILPEQLVSAMQTTFFLAMSIIIFKIFYH